ncbi:GNAT family N-acetyltransferase [Anaerolineales bacterium HSG25]|nr:GNAT family N-acetyltransferase [Anaerolineales bacterium HSG25]
MNIRLAQLEDAPHLNNLLRDLEFFSYFNEEDPVTSIARIKQYLHQCLTQDSHSIYLVETDAVLVGYTAVQWLTYLFLPGPEGYVTELFIRSDYRGQGLGSQLLAAVEAEAKRRGCARLALINNNTRESYQREFYKKQSWQERQQMVNFIKILVED